MGDDGESGEKLHIVEGQRAEMWERARELSPVAWILSSRSLCPHIARLQVQSDRVARADRRSFLLDLCVAPGSRHRPWKWRRWWLGRTEVMPWQLEALLRTENWGSTLAEEETEIAGDANKCGRRAGHRQRPAGE